MIEHVSIGDPIEFEESAENYFAISFLPLDVFDDWERGSKLANFLADYYYHNFQSESSHNLISTVCNEIIENAVKFSRNNSSPIEIIAKKRRDHLLVRTTNTISNHRCSSFMKTCKDLFREDLDELYIQRIEEGSEIDDVSGIGLILIKKDYDSRVSFDFYRDETSQVSVTIEININQGQSDESFRD